MRISFDLDDTLVCYRADVPQEPRLPFKLVYEERKRGRSSALKREAAIKKLTRRQKLALIRGASRCC